MAEFAITPDPDELLTEVDAGIGWVTLNRPKALNALSLGMIRRLTAILQEWASDSTVRAVVVQGAGGRAFCAGGDVRAAYEAKQQGNLDLLESYFREEYTLNTLVHEYPKPYIAILDGIAMGGGLGISLNSPHSVVTERSLLAMPETSIGFFPDVGATWFLGRLPHNIGVYLGLTGHRFSGADVVSLGLASTYVGSDQLPALLQALREGEDVFPVLAAFAALPGVSPLRAHEEEIQLHFGQDAVEGIFESLEMSLSSFAKETLETLRTKSPLSLAVTFEQLHGLDPDATFRACMQREFRMSQRFTQGHDFFEGVRAVLVDKDQAPQWNPGTLEEVSPEQVKGFFARLGDKELGGN